MKIINKQSRKSIQGFTLIEMIGVLAVIAILASMLIPKIFEAINSARVNNGAVTCNTVKASIADHYAKAGTLPVDDSGATPVVMALPIEHYDKVPLLKEGFLDKPFAVKIGDGVLTGDNNRVRAFDSSALALGGAAFVVEAVVYGVAAADAIEISERLDGVSLSEAANSQTADLRGRVIYAAGATTEVHIYICHR